MPTSCAPKPGRQRRRVPQCGDVDDGDVLGGRAEGDPQPAPRTVDRQVARPAGQLDAAEHPPGRDVERRDAAAPGVGDERVPPVGMRDRVPRLDEPAQQMPHATAVDDRDGADRGMADDGAVADELDRARIRDRRESSGDPERAEVDHCEPRLSVARDERRRQRRRQGGAQPERRCRGEREELGPVHALSTTAGAAGVPTCEKPRARFAV